MAELAKYQTIENFHSFECFEGSFIHQVFPWHFHDNYTLILVEKGAVTYEFRHAKKVVSAGELLIIHPFVSHFNYATTKSGWSYRVFFVPMMPAEINSPRHAMTHHRHFFPEPFHNADLHASLLVRHRQLTTTTDQDLRREIYSEIREVLATQIPSWESRTPVDLRIQAAIDYIIQHVPTKISIEQLAHLAGLSPFHFQRLFKEQIGIAAHAFITMKRIEMGKVLLRSGQSITSAAMDAGFYDQSHFHHQFKKMYGLTPKQFSLTA